MGWTRKTFDGMGLTQYPVGRNLAVLQARLGGAVVLCLDVSGSMSGDRLDQAKAGCARFVAEAEAARYSIGGVLWHHDVAGSSSLDRGRAGAAALFDSAVASGGNAITPALRRCERLLDEMAGDRVIAVFGDGDLGPQDVAIAEASRLAAKGIRVITCGLGEESAELLDAISSETAPARVAAHDDIAGAIARMSSALRRG